MRVLQRLASFVLSVSILLPASHPLLFAMAEIVS